MQKLVNRLSKSTKKIVMGIELIDVNRCKPLRTVPVTHKYILMITIKNAI